MSFRPALRSRVTLTARSDGGGTLNEPLLDWTMTFSPAHFAIVQRLDGTRDLTALARDAEAPAERVEYVVRTLMLLSLLDGAGDRIVARIGDLASGRARLAPLTLEEARFACQGSGDCCRNYTFGPISHDDIARLDALDLAGAFPHLAGESFWHERAGSDGRMRLYLRNDGDHCTFLQPDGHCGVHARFGSEAKPLMCQLYPLEQLPTIAGRKIYDKGSCSTFATSARTGRPLVEELPRVAALLPNDLELFHPVAMVDGDTPCDYGHLVALAAALCRMVAHPQRGQAATMRAVVSRARAFRDALAHCPLAPGEPEATADRCCAAERDSDDSDEVASSDGAALQPGLEGLMQLCDTLTNVSIAAFARPQPQEHGHLVTARRGSDLTHALHIVRAVAAHRHTPTEAELPSLATIAIDDPEHDELFRISLRQQLFGRNFLVDERLAPGLLRIGMVWLVTRWVARLHAAGDGAMRVGLAHWSAGHTLANRVVGSTGIAGAFLDHEADAWSILAALPSLA